MNIRMEYLKILIFLVSAVAVVSFLFLVAFFVNERTTGIGKHTPVECGCEPLGSGKSRMEINYYVISILFIIFEIEFIVLLP